MVALTWSCLTGPAAVAETAALETPRAVLGLYGVEPASFDTVAAVGFNTVQTYRLETTTPEDVESYVTAARSYLDAAESHGLHVLLGLPRSWVLSGNSEAVTQAIRLLRDHPALLAWYEDELGQKGHVDEIVRLGALVARMDTVHGLAIEEGRDVAALRSVGQWRMFTYYPVTISARRSRTIGSVVDRFPVQESKMPFWPVLQAFGQDAITGFPKPQKLVPDRRELQYTLYSSVVHGAQGIFFYTFSHPTRYDPELERQGKFAYQDYRVLPSANRRLWLDVVALLREARVLLSRIEDPSAQPVATSFRAPRGLEAAQWRTGLQELFVIANPRYEPATVRVAAPSGATRYAVLLGGTFGTGRAVEGEDVTVEVPGPGGVAILFGDERQPVNAQTQ